MTEELIVEVGKYYNNRERAVVYCVGESPWAPSESEERFLILDKRNAYEAYSVSIKGEYEPGKRTPQDLISEAKPKLKLMGFVNIYGSDNKVDFCDVEPTKKQAERYAVKERFACLDLSKYDIEFEEGEGL